LKPPSFTVELNGEVRNDVQVEDSGDL